MKRKRGRPVTLSPEQKAENQRRRWKQKQAKKRKGKGDAAWQRRNPFGFVLPLEVAHYDQLIKALVADGLLDPDDAYIPARVDEAVDELLSELSGVQSWSRFGDRFDQMLGLRRSDYFPPGRAGTVRIRVTAEIANSLVEPNCRAEFIKSRPKPQPDRELVRQYRRAQAHEQRCERAYFSRGLDGPDRLEAKIRAGEDWREATAAIRKLEEQIYSDCPVEINEAELAEFAERLKLSRGFLRQVAEHTLYWWYSSDLREPNHPAPCVCEAKLAECDCLLRFRIKDFRYALGAERVRRPHPGRPITSNTLYSGRNKRWWGDRRFSGSKQNDDAAIRSHDKSASVGMEGFYAGGARGGPWRNNDPIRAQPQTPEKRDRDRMATQAGKVLQKPFDDPEGTPKSWSNPADADPDNDDHVTRIGRRVIEETLIEPKREQEEDD
jgi:hypothetical protein